MTKLWDKPRCQRVVVAGLVASVGVLVGTANACADDVLKIGVLGVMSGPYAAWGLVNKYAAEATAEMYNEQGGVDIGGKKYKIEIDSVDDQADPKLAVTGAQRLILQDGVKYIIGPNVDSTIASAQPIAEKYDAMMVSYSFTRSLFSPPHMNTVLGIIPGYQTGPVVFKYLQDHEALKSVSFLVLNTAEALKQRDESVAAAKKLQLAVASSEVTYESGTTDFFPVVSKVVGDNPGLIVLSGVAPADAPKIVKTARQLGYKGLLEAETAQDINILTQGAGEAANGFISLGGASTPELQSDYMTRFIEHYKKIAGEWNDEAGTKVYALEMILRTIQAAGPAAIADTEPFKKQIPTFSVTNPFIKGDTKLRYVGKAYFGQQRQIGLPMVINTVQGSVFKTLFVGTVQ
ncbi:MAG: ABC transporter substrate-binding protein [Devosia sp.]|nr:ABC transporter substrate-binding protein [Devosia sp.]